MDIGELASMYGGLPPRIVTRAREIMRLAAAKRTIALEMTTPVASLVVACRDLDEPIEMKKLAALLGINPRTVDQAARKIFNVLNLQDKNRVTPASLCVRHGCAEITELVNRVYAEYQVLAQHMSRGPGGTGVRVFDPNNAMFAAACMYAAAKRAKRRVDRVKLVADVSANMRAFEAVVSSVEAHCRATLAGGASSVSSRGRSSTAETPAISGPVTRQPVGKTKAAQRAAMVLERAVRRGDQSRNTDEVKAAAGDKAGPESDVTMEEYHAWRANVIAMRRQQGLPPFAPSTDTVAEAVDTERL